MLFDGAFRHEKATGNTTVREPFRHERQHLLLTRGELRERVLPVTLCDELVHEA